MKIFKTTIVIFVLMFVSKVLYAQEDYEFYLQNARQRLAEGDCSRAEMNYNMYKEMTNKTDYGIEQQIEECKFDNRDLVVDVNGVSFVMKPVQGGFFWMGAQRENPYGLNYDIDANDNESPVHEVKVSSFYIGETEVTEELWKAVMGKCPINNGDNYPVMIDNNELCVAFIGKLNKITGLDFRLPTEAEWEYAARGGKNSKGYKYAGSDNFDDVVNRGVIHSVKEKQPNELGLYDMSGNVWEWCGDWFGQYDDTFMINPIGPLIGPDYVLRGGGFVNSSDRGCRVSQRSHSWPTHVSTSDCGLRLVISQREPSSELTEVERLIEERKLIYDNAPIDGHDLSFNVNGISFIMKPVNGGFFKMGCEYGNNSVAWGPTHNVNVSSFYIGETEVTQALWKAVMGTTPSYNGGWTKEYGKGDNYPAYYVNWNDCLEFIRKLNNMTGKNFRLPTEAEWEYAARGGNNNYGLNKSLSMRGDEKGGVWNKSNSQNTTHIVKELSPNLLGLYDMCGNVREWCNDWYESDYYLNSPFNNPKGPSNSSINHRVLRGGDWNSAKKYSQVYSRSDTEPWQRCNDVGFRLVLSE